MTHDPYSGRPDEESEDQTAADGRDDEHADESPSTDVDETSEQSFPTSDPPSTWSSAGQDDA